MVEDPNAPSPNVVIESGSGQETVVENPNPPEGAAPGAAEEVFEVEYGDGRKEALTESQIRERLAEAKKAEEYKRKLGEQGNEIGILRQMVRGNQPQQPAPSQFQNQPQQPPQIPVFDDEDFNDPARFNAKMQRFNEGIRPQTPTNVEEIITRKTQEAILAERANQIIESNPRLRLMDRSAALVTVNAAVEWANREMEMGRGQYPTHKDAVEGFQRFLSGGSQQSTSPAQLETELIKRIKRGGAEQLPAGQGPTSTPKLSDEFAKKTPAERIEFAKKAAKNPALHEQMMREFYGG